MAIIGVVAALTIPTVVRNYQKTQAATQLKKVYMQLSQAIQMASIDYGSPKTWNYCEFVQTSAGRKQFSEKYFKPYLKVIKEYPTGTSFSGKYKWLNGDNISGGWIVQGENYDFVLSDGTMIALEHCVSGTSQSVVFHIDINGTNNQPNIAGKDYFIFQLDKSRGRLRNWANYTKKGAEDNCKKTQRGESCGAKIMYDGWQIKYDW